MALFRQAAIAAIATCITFSAQASQLPPILEHALEQGELANQIRWSFTQSFESGETNFRFRFIPTESEGAFTLLSPERLTGESERIYTRLTEDPDPDSDLTHEQARIVIGDQDILIVEETDTLVTYAVAPNPWDDLDEAEAQMMEHITAELTIDKATEQVSRIRLYNHEPFHAMVVARVNRFEQVMTFAPEPVTGLPLMTSFRQEVEGSALFSRFSRVRQETYSEFQPVDFEVATGGCTQTACIREFLSAR